MILLKTILNKWFQFTYLQNIFFKWFDSISFVFNFQEKLFTLLVSKEFITKFQFEHKDYFYLFLLGNNEFLQFYLQKYFDSFSFKKKWFIQIILEDITLFEKEILIKKKKKI